MLSMVSDLCVMAPTDMLLGKVVLEMYLSDVLFHFGVSK